MKQKFPFILLSVVAVAMVMTIANAVIFEQVRAEGKRQAQVHVETSLRLFWHLLHSKGKGSYFHEDRGRLLVGSYVINGNSDVPDEVLAITGNRATVFMGDTRVATNVEDRHGRRAIGTKLTSPVYDMVIRKGLPYRGDARVLGKPYVTAYDPIKDASGKTIGALFVGVESDRRALGLKVVAINTAEAAIFLSFGLFVLHIRRRSADAIHKQFRFLQVLLDTIPSPIFVKDRAGRYCECNVAYEEFVQVKREDLVGRTVHDLWPVHLADQYHRMDLELFAGGGVQTYECSVKSAAGTHLDVIFLKAVYRDAAGLPAGLVGVILDITERRKQERALREAQSDLMYASRLAGMAETATIVLHNVGNVLNSVNVSAGIINQCIRSSKAPALRKAVGMMQEHRDDLAAYLSTDDRGKLLPEYLAKVVEVMEMEHQDIEKEIDALIRSVEHIKQIVVTQQRFAGTTSIVEHLQVRDLVSDALRMDADSAAGSGVTIVEDIDEMQEFSLDRARVLQILVNLIRNAKQAVCAREGSGGRITISAGVVDEESLRISIADDGIGIPAENLTRIFNHGFTTRRNGNGFGLHSCALAAKGMGGSLTVHSDGPGSGATFTLTLPIGA
ncbi:cache domain-containing protein [Geomonas sp. RF6]|uniref:cache domain-containing protein n=1 Tax=Geomonas sp. RF6 TaxID=2897342 RepID=UPI001E62405F|nr:cache domain-containing protein [Geomonas sp. RF6]UFS70745.1 cache domain-containing protein [Geomonas sp. RF6]